MAAVFLQLDEVILGTLPGNPEVCSECFTFVSSRKWRASHISRIVRALSEIDAVHYLPRNHVPTLLIAGRDDYVVPVETHQRPLLRLLGTAAHDKRHVILDCGDTPSNFQDVIKEVVPWLDRYLGPVQTTRAR